MIVWPSGSSRRYISLTGYLQCHNDLPVATQSTVALGNSGNSNHFVAIHDGGVKKLLHGPADQLATLLD